MKLVEWARRQGISYKTAWRWVKSGRRLIDVDSSEMNDDLVQDMIAVLTSFCARRYGRRSARNRAISIERALAREPQA